MPQIQKRGKNKRRFALFCFFPLYSKETFFDGKTDGKFLSQLKKNVLEINTSSRTRCRLRVRDIPLQRESLVVCVRRACRSVDHRELSLTLTARYASLVRARRVVSIQKSRRTPCHFS